MHATWDIGWLGFQNNLLIKSQVNLPTVEVALVKFTKTAQTDYIDSLLGSQKNPCASLD